MMIPFLPALLKLVLALPVIGPFVHSLLAAVFPSLLEAATGGKAKAGDSCCPASAWPSLEADDARMLSGAVEELGNGLHGYVSAPKTPTGRAVIVVYDVFGLSGGRMRTVCDVLAAEGFLVIMPDFFGDEDSIDKHGGLVNIGSDECVGWLKSHAWGDLQSKLRIALGFAASHGVPAANMLMQPPFNDNRVAIVGFCWGAWLAAKASGTGMIKAAVHVHPSWQISSWLFNEPEEAMAAKIRAATLLMPAGDDKDAYRDGTYAQIIEKNGGVTVALKDFPNQRHGFVIRGSPEDKAVMADVKVALTEMASFLHKHIKPVE
jgi:dienelactone hydrolase